jgi:hypothetical protein
MLNKIVEWIGAALVATLVVVVVMIVLSFPLSWVWNAAMPYLFGWPELSWWRTLCLWIVVSVLLGLGNVRKSK